MKEALADKKRSVQISKFREVKMIYINIGIKFLNLVICQLPNSLIRSNKITY